MKKGFIGCFFIFFLSMTLLTGGVLFYFGMRDLRRAKESDHWPTTSGKVLLSEVVTESSNDHGPIYKASIVYVYSVDQKEQTSSRISFGSFDSSDPAPAHAKVRKYPKDATVTVHYHPSTPDVSVLETGERTGSYVLPGIGLVLLLGGGSVIVTGLIVWRAIQNNQRKKATATIR